MCGRVNVWNWTSELLSCNQHRLVVNLGTDRAKQKCHVLNSPVNKEPRDRVSGWLCSALLRIDCLDWETEGLGSGEEMCPKSQCPWMEEGCLEGGRCGSWKRGQILEIRDTNTRGCPVGFARHCGPQRLATASHGGAETTMTVPISLWEGQSGPTQGHSAWGARVRAPRVMGGQQAGVPPAGWVCLGGEGLAGDLAGLHPSRLWAESTYVCQLVGVCRASEAPQGVWCACKPPANPSIQTGSRLVFHSLPPLAVTRSVLLRQHKAAASLLQLVSGLQLLHAAPALMDLCFCSFGGFFFLFSYF